ncbi:MAG TPA: glycosyltransferase family 1 protein [Candidatus Binatia bacterium]|nr:glycosyltransferase family 1 protein [Candidatus Binatia bacterium]
MARIRVGIDVRKLGDGGIGEYIRETLIAARQARPEIDIVAFGTPGAQALLPLDRVDWVPVASGKYSIAEHFMLPAATRGRAIDVFHAPHYVLPLALSIPAVVTIHDLIHVLFPRSALHRLYARLMIASACRRARRIITVSEATARDLREHLGVAPDKIRVVWNGVAPRFRPLPPAAIDRALGSLAIERPYVLFVGNCLPHKNVETLVRAWDRLPEPRPALVLCGSGFDRSRVVRAAIAETRGGERVRVVDRADRDALVALYNGAELLASTSLYEGFCLPVVEAFACGTPVLAPDCGALPEVTGDAAIRVPPRRVDTVACEMYRLLTDPDLRKGLVERGKEQAARFSWAEAAEKTLSVYEEVLANP